MLLTTGQETLGHLTSLGFSREIWKTLDGISIGYTSTKYL